MGVLIKPQTEQTEEILCTVDITTETAGWQYVSFAVYHLRKGQALRGAANGRETAVIVLTGTGQAGLNGTVRGADSASGSASLKIKPRMRSTSPRMPDYQVECTSDNMEVAITSAPTTHRHLAARLIRPEEVSVELRGEGNTRRRVQHILDTDQEAEHLIIVEVITPAGNWSSFPPHKHDTEKPPYEAYLEETYYHHVQPADGFAFQRVYDLRGI